jgi:hypothetical protein
MAIPNQSGYYDNSTGLIRPASSDTWDDHSGYTWDNWTSWDKPGNTIVWYQPVVDLIPYGVSNFTLNITTISTGLVSYKIYTSPNGLFRGEETETIINQGATNVPSFSGKFVLVVTTCTYNNQPLTLGTCTITPIASNVLEMRYSDLDTSTLAGTSSSRTLPLSQTVSQVVDILITPHEVTSYALDLYVSHTATSTYVIPKIISKAITGPTFALVGLDNQPRDAVVDIIVKGLPSQRMSGNNLISN